MPPSHMLEIEEIKPVDLLRRLQTVQGRVLTGSLFALSLVAGFWYGHEGDVDPVRLTACIGTGIAWLLAELTSGRSVSARDIELYKSFFSTIPQSTKDFLWDHDFAASFHDPGRNGIFEVAAWKGSRYDFVDKVLQSEWLRLRTVISTFATNLASNTYPISGSANFFTVHPTQGDPEDPAPFVQKRIDTLNEGATALVESIDNFERLAVERLNL